MSRREQAPDERLLEALVLAAAARTGFRPDAIRVESIRQLAAGLLARMSPHEVLARVARGDDAIGAALEAASVVAETYFFRQLEHFEMLQGELPRRVGDAPLRAWSAGCATGEEAYSVAALLRAVAPAPRAISVLGTDLVARNVEAARAASYPRRALRAPAPLFPLFEPGGGGELRVAPELRAVTTFAVHNLLEAPTFGPFDLVFCRNVLLYFSEEARRAACANLVAALAPEGLLVFSPMDVFEVPPGVRRVGSPELQMFRRARRVSEAPPPSRRSRRPKTVPPPAAKSRAGATLEDPLAMHVAALEHIDRGEVRRAAQILSELCARAPAYLPGLVERALLHAKSGERQAAIAMMRSVLERARRLDPDAIVDGPEPLPVRYFTASARALLEHHGVLE